MDSSSSSRRRWLDRIGYPLPVLERADRLEVLKQVEAGAQGGADYLVMMVLSSGLASLGLLQDSTAVVIGAMLVAPLMGPLIGAGLGLAQGNLVLHRKSILVALQGLLVGFLMSVGIGLVNPGFETTLEIEARGNPDIFDLGVAVFSGFVAAYAIGRPGLKTTLAGVAIAAALVPPLCVVGISLTNDRPDIAANSAILLLTNVVAINLSAASVFALLGFLGANKNKGGAKRWVLRALVTSGLLLTLLLLPLLGNFIEGKRLGQNKPLVYPVSAELQENVEDYLRSVPGVSLLTIARAGVEPRSSVSILLTSSGGVPKDIKGELIRLVMEAHGGDPDVRIVVLREVLEQ